MQTTWTVRMKIDGIWEDAVPDADDELSRAVDALMQNWPSEEGEIEEIRLIVAEDARYECGQHSAHSQLK
jgi:hypothetical protein